MPPAGRLARNLLPPGVTSERRSAVAENHRQLSDRTARTNPDAGARAREAGSPGSRPDTLRVETGAVAQHRAGNTEQTVGHRAQGARVSVAAGA